LSVSHISAREYQANFAGLSNFYDTPFNDRSAKKPEKGKTGQIKAPLLRYYLAQFPEK
jgi:hypothetical protein